MMSKQVNSKCLSDDFRTGSVTKMYIFVYMFIKHYQISISKIRIIAHCLYGWVCSYESGNTIDKKYGTLYLRTMTNKEINFAQIIADFKNI